MKLIVAYFDKKIKGVYFESYKEFRQSYSAYLNLMKNQVLITDHELKFLLTLAEKNFFKNHQFHFNGSFSKFYIHTFQSGNQYLHKMINQ
jgi:hypothetical protein